MTSTVISLKDSTEDPDWDENYNHLRSAIEDETQEFNFLIYPIDRKKFLEKVDNDSNGEGDESNMMSLDTLVKYVDFSENKCISNGDDLELGYDSDDSTNGAEAYLLLKLLKMMKNMK